MARYTAFFPRTTTDSAVQDDGDCYKNERQSKEGSADIRYQDALYVSDEVLST